MTSGAIGRGDVLQRVAIDSHGGKTWGANFGKKKSRGRQLVENLQTKLKQLLNAIPGLPAFASEAITRDALAQVRTWQKLHEIVADCIVENPAQNLPDLFSGVTDCNTLFGLMAFAAVYGGQRVYMPQRLAPDHPFREIAGDEAAAHLIKTLGGDTFVVPRLNKIYYMCSRKAIIEAKAIGRPLNDIVQLYQQNFNRVLEIIRKG